MILSLLIGVAFAAGGRRSQTGCCYNYGMGAMMVECCQNPHAVMEGEMVDEYGMIARKDCPSKQNIGGATKFVADVNCDDLAENGWSTDLFDSILMPEETITVETEAQGCCYNHGMGWNGVEYGVCCQSPHESQPEDGMLGASSCPQEDRAGGATAFVEGVTCEEFEEMGWEMAEDEPEEMMGCCYNQGLGWNGVSYGPCCQAAHDSQPENDMLGVSSCPTEQRTGGSTEFVEGVTCEEFELMGWEMSDAPKDDDTDDDDEGCCYNVGFGAMMAECCHNAHESQPDNEMLAASSCPTESRMGGATRFQAGVTCEEFESKGWTMDETEEMGCCYNVGYGAGMEECCHNAHESQPENGMLGASSCPTEEMRIGGATKFQAGMTCEDFEAMEWTLEEETPAVTFADHKMEAKRKKNREDCVALGAKWKASRDKCKAHKEHKFKCRRVKDMDVCDMYGCNIVRNKCRGRPMWAN